MSCEQPNADGTNNRADILMCSVNRIKSFFLQSEESSPPRGLQHSVVATGYAPFFCFMCFLGLCVKSQKTKDFSIVTFSLLGLLYVCCVYLQCKCC